MSVQDATGAIVILAYPEEFVSMIPAWYRKPMEWLGMVNEGKICVGHSAMALINKATGVIHYADFGRYITPFGCGRTRMVKTDPDVAFDYTVVFDEDGFIVDKIALFEHIFQHPEKTHGGDSMFVSLNQNIDFDSCFNFISTMNAKGSIKYDPFGKDASNCSRFVFDAILAGMKSSFERKRLKRKSPLTASPLANVFYGTDDDSYEFTPSGANIVTDKSLKKIVSYFFKKPTPTSIMKDEFQPSENMSLLGGVGDHAYFKLDEILQENKAIVTKLDKNGVKTFTHSYRLTPDFDPKAPFKFVHDSNAAWITIEQKNKRFRFERFDEVVKE